MYVLCLFLFKFDFFLNVVIKNSRMCVWAYQKYAGTHILKYVITKKKLIKPFKKSQGFLFFWIFFFRECLFSPWNGWLGLFWTWHRCFYCQQIFVKLLQDMFCVMCDVWCVYESKGNHKYPSDLFKEIPKLIPGGSCIYTISCNNIWMYFLANKNVPNECPNIFALKKFNQYFGK